MAKIRLANPAMATFSAHMGTVKFENGVSVDDVSTAEMRRLAALTKIEMEDADGNWSQVGLANDMATGRGIAAPNVRTLKRESEPSKAPEEINPGPEKIEGEKDSESDDPLQDVERELEQTQEEVAETDPDAEPAKVYTREELEEIADQKGIKGLREIADPLGAKDNSINGLVQDILNKQPKG